MCKQVDRAYYISSYVKNATNDFDGTKSSDIGETYFFTFACFQPSYLIKFFSTKKTAAQP